MKRGMLALIVFLLSGATAQGYTLSWYDFDDNPGAAPGAALGSTGAMSYDPQRGRWVDAMIDSFRPSSGAALFTISSDNGRTGPVDFEMIVDGRIGVSEVRPVWNARLDGDEALKGDIRIVVMGREIRKDFTLYPEGEYRFRERLSFSGELDRKTICDISSFYWSWMEKVEFATDYPSFSDMRIDSTYDYAVTVDLRLPDEAPAPVPEPSTFLLMGGGLAGWLARWRRR